MKVVIIDYGVGNIKNIQFAFERLGITAQLSQDTDLIKQADRVILPGVGEASSAMIKLKETRLDELIPTLKQPVLGICLGMQLMCNYSEEGHTNGLQIFDTQVKRFTKSVKVPQMGWNTINNLKTDLFFNVKMPEYMYLVHSYYAENCSQAIAVTEYDLLYASALKKDNFYGVQFHPEKSSKAGEQILKNFLNL
ncbi:imidazole glycerol phosphate synthase subunit HisH [Bizionia argentinensis JUB59]|uniref:Imidazole glycerol phosphate synthase subunit HisH n=1 Tax=Bizionia argentinensis JUB59 TaxID=1046627 RepID=G2E9E1_9FLAO|nr:imidazole glycerol phosphate synthase subunit HisH [Bizionia argentinensis]EGV44764.1 imidazole glycerol phosphate synthase subunit HisH [Bizionia argentinensis JUB59]